MRIATARQIAAGLGTLFVFLQAASAQGISVAESVLTQHNDIRRTGVYPSERILTRAALTRRGLERLCTWQVDGQVAAQPLFVKGVSIHGQPKDVLYVATRRNSIYAFDANAARNGASSQAATLWHIGLTYTALGGDPNIPRGTVFAAAPLKNMDDAGTSSCRQTHGPVGITSTPVIDPVSNLMYVVFRVAAGPDNPRLYGNVTYHFLAAIDISTGQEVLRTLIRPRPKPGQAPEFNPCPTGSTDFNACAEINRPGLLLMNNVIYVAFGGAVCDAGPWHRFEGWVFAYHVRDLALLDTYRTAPSPPGGAGIWQSGSGLAGDVGHNVVYATTGNSNSSAGGEPGWDYIFEHQTGGGRDQLYDASRTDVNESVLKLQLTSIKVPLVTTTVAKFLCDPRYTAGCVADHFTAGNWYRLDSGYLSKDDENNHPTHVAPDGDSDVGAGGPVVLANGWVLAAGKQGRLYVIDPADMRHAKQGFQLAFNTYHLPSPGQPPQPPCKTQVTNPADYAPKNHGKNCSVDPQDYDFAQAYGPNVHGSPVVWEAATSDYGYLYVMAEKDYLRAYKVFRDGRVEEHDARNTASSPPHVGQILKSPDGMPGAALSLSANGNQNGILWVAVSPNPDQNQIQEGRLMAFDALSLDLLWYEPKTDFALAKFVPPTIAGGRVFLPTFGDLTTCPELFQSDPNTGPKRTCGTIMVYGLGLDQGVSPAESERIHRPPTHP